MFQTYKVASNSFLFSKYKLFVVNEINMTYKAQGVANMAFQIGITDGSGLRYETNE